jgi:hypothetical protein
MARLVLDYEGVGLVAHELAGDFVFIGRAPSNQIVVDHPAVSAHHALFLRVGDSYWLKDLDSTNRTQINGVLVNEVELKDGDRIQFGSVGGVYAGSSRKQSSALGIQDAIEESYMRKAIGESLLAHLDKEIRMCGRPMHRSAVDFWANHIRQLKDS